MLLIAEHDHLVLPGDLSIIKADESTPYSELTDKENRIYHFRRALPQTPAEKFRLIFYLVSENMSGTKLPKPAAQILSKVITVLNIKTDTEKKVVKLICHQIAKGHSSEEIYAKVQHLL